VAERKSAEERAADRAEGVHGQHRMQQPEEPRRGQDKNARPAGEDGEQVEPGLPRANRPEDRDTGEYEREMSGRRGGRRGRGGDAEREEYERERERDSQLPLEERRPEYLTEEERTEQVEHVHRIAPPGYSPTAGLGERE